MLHSQKFRGFAVQLIFTARTVIAILHLKIIFVNSTMLFSRFVLFIIFALLCWGTNVLAQTTPIQFPHVAQPQVQPQQVQQQAVQQQRLQQERMQTPLFGTQGSPSVYQSQSLPMRPGTGAPTRVASSDPVPSGQSVPLYNPGINRVPITIQHPASQEIPQGMPPVGRTEHVNRIVPFSLNPAEQRELDEFLVRWERYSTNIKRYDVDFNVFEYDPTHPDAMPNRANRVLFGSFKYIATPMRFLYVIEGEYRDGKYIKREGDKNLHIYAEKIIIDDKTVSKYDYNAKTVHQINVPPTMIGKGIADSPLPLIFGANADDLKRRFSMKVITDPNGTLRLYARPLLIEDQSEFKELVILLDKDLRAQGLQQWDINDKSYKVFAFPNTPKINDKLGNILGDIATIFKPDVERGWKKEIHEWNLQPPPAPATPQMPMGNPALQQQQFRSESPLYQGR